MAAAVGIGASALGFVFVWSALAKLRDPAAAGEAIASFGLTRRAIPAAAVLAATLELGLGLLLISGFARVGALVATAALLLFFSIVIGHNLRLGRRFPCGCFGAVDGPLSTVTLLRSAALAVTALGLAAAAWRSEAGSGWRDCELALHAIGGLASLGLLVTTIAFVAVARSPRLQRGASA